MHLNEKHLGGFSLRFAASILFVLHPGSDAKCQCVTPEMDFQLA